MSKGNVYYSEYLQLDKILDAQMPESKLAGNEAHDEMLFIIIHQTYELWFKQVLHEIQSVTKVLNQDRIVDTSPDLQIAVHRLKRVVKILEIAVKQVDVIETMTPLDFLDFRDMLRPASGFQSIQSKDSKIIIAGGQENMSLAPHAIHLRDGKKLGDAELIDTMIKDGLWDAFHGYHMGVTAENVAEKFQITREEQDKFAFKSQEKAKKAQKEDKFKDEIVNLKIKSNNSEIDFNKDEHLRENVNLESLSRLKPVFKKDGTVTAGNASGINDGAAAVAIMSSDEAKKRNMDKLVSIKSWASCGVDPALMGTGPIPSSKKALELAGWTVNDVDLFEINEAFAAQSIAVVKTLAIPDEKVNVNGGAIAIGHPIGASGTRILVTLIHEMIKRDVKKGLATLCIGGGMGIAMCVER